MIRRSISFPSSGSKVSQARNYHKQAAGKRRRYVHSKRRGITSLHGVTNQKIIVVYCENFKSDKNEMRFSLILRCLRSINRACTNGILFSNINVFHVNIRLL
jgi:hypothetical protein